MRPSLERAEKQDGWVLNARWKIHDNFITGLAAVWAFGWLPMMLVVWAVGAPDGLNYDGTYWPAVIPMLIWIGTPVVIACLWGLVLLVRTLWRYRPTTVRFDEVRSNNERI